MKLPSEGESKIDLFRKKEIRKVLHKGEWWFALVDIIEALTDSKDPKQYIRDMRKRDAGLDSNWGEIITPLQMLAADGKLRNTSCVNIEGVFRLIQSIPSKKVEPFKKWLAKVGFERLEEIKNPELAIKRAITYYRAKGYDDEWIEARITNKSSRETLTSEWDRRGMSSYIGILTDAISIETFGITTKRHKQIKGLKSQGLRDNMTPIELTLNTLGEQATTQIVQSTNPQSLDQNKDAAKRGGKIAGDARKAIEEATKQKVVSSQNYLTERQRQNNAQSNQEISIIIQKLLGVPKNTKLASSVSHA